MTGQLIEQSAADLLASRRWLRPLHVLTARHDLDVATAYRIQTALVERIHAASGDVVGGYKIMLSSALARSYVQADQPAFGLLSSGALLASGSVVDLADCLALTGELEVVVTATADWPTDASAEEIRRLSEVRAGLELPDSHYTASVHKGQGHPPLRAADTIADNGSARWLLAADRGLAGTDLEPGSARAALLRDGELVTAGAENGDPFELCAWLVRELASHGRQVRRGMFVDSGTVAAPVPMLPGTYEVLFRGLPAAHLRVV